MESWVKVWREGFAPAMTVEQLRAVEKALAEDDKRLLQGRTTEPPPLLCVQDWPCEGADVVSYFGWQGGNNPEMTTVGEVEEFFAKMCFEADGRLEEPAACRHLLNYWDDTPRGEALQAMLAEVRLAIQRKSEATAVAA